MGCLVWAADAAQTKHPNLFSTTFAGSRQTPSKPAFLKIGVGLSKKSLSTASEKKRPIFLAAPLSTHLYRRKV
jgi:hypothetical protein